MQFQESLVWHFALGSLIAAGKQKIFIFPGFGLTQFMVPLMRFQ
jgi:hypothetical protein